jgi:hypothetical protein
MDEKTVCWSDTRVCEGYRFCCTWGRVTFGRHPSVCQPAVKVTGPYQKHVKSMGTGTSKSNVPYQKHVKAWERVRCGTDLLWQPGKGNLVPFSISPATRCPGNPKLS